MKDKLKRLQAARPQDIPQIVAFAYSAYKDGEFKTAPPNFNKITNSLTDAVMNQVVIVERNKDDDALIDGVMVLKYGDFCWWSIVPALNQLFFFVKKEARGFSVLQRLLDSLDEYNGEESLPIVQSIIGKDFERKGKLLERKGYNKVGVVYVKEKK